MINSLWNIQKFISYLYELLKNDIYQLDCKVMNFSSSFGIILDLNLEHDDYGMEHDDYGM